MHEPVYWIGGWASNLACWRPQLEALYPGHEHTFWDVHSFLDEPGLLKTAVESISGGGTLVAWSLGSLVLHRAMIAEGLRPKYRLLSVSPIFDFCRPPSPWPQAALSRMMRRLDRARESVLSEFWQQVIGTSLVSPEISDAWIRQSEHYTLHSLLTGLNALADCKLDYPSLPAIPGHRFLASKLDPLSPTEADLLSSPAWIEYPCGHLPFFDFPKLFGTCLK